MTVKVTITAPNLKTRVGVVRKKQQSKRTKILPLWDESNTGIFIRGRRFSDREKVFTQVVRYIIDRSVYLFE
jgi:hypothetical protein